MNEMYKLYAERKSALQGRLKEFSQVRGDDIFYELCFCLLTPQSKGKNCWNVVVQLKQRNYLRSDVELASLLKGSVRFHNTKARRLKAMKEKYERILKQLSSNASAFELREWLVQNVQGIGYKEASHFLRNVGYRDLAILDRHILRNLQKYKVVKSIPRTLTRNRYLTLERKFRRFAQERRIPFDELDLLFWSAETGEVFK